MRVLDPLQILGDNGTVLLTLQQPSRFTKSTRRFTGRAIVAAAVAAINCMQIDVLLEGIWTRWHLALLILCSIVLAIIMLCARTPKLGIRVAVVLIAIGICISTGRSISTTCHLIELRGESDTESARAYSVLIRRLSDEHLIRLLEREKNANARFYLALMAGERQLQVPKDLQITAPAFFVETSLNKIARQVSFPINGEQFVQKVQSVGFSHSRL